MHLIMNNERDSKGTMVRAGGRDEVAVARLRATCLSQVTQAERYLDKLEKELAAIRGNLRRTRMGLADASVSLGSVSTPGAGVVGGVADVACMAICVAESSARVDALLMAGYEAEGGGQ
jgi:hypothetical protein